MIHCNVPRQAAGVHRADPFVDRAVVTDDCLTALGNGNCAHPPAQG